MRAAHAACMKHFSLLTRVQAPRVGTPEVSVRSRGCLPDARLRGGPRGAHAARTKVGLAPL